MSRRDRKTCAERKWEVNESQEMQAIFAETGLSCGFDNNINTVFGAREHPREWPRWLFPSRSELAPNMLYRTYRSGTIKVQSPEVTSDSPAVQQRLDRIADNYRQLEALLSEVEAQFPTQPLPALAVADEGLAEPRSFSRRLSRRKPK